MNPEFTIKCRKLFASRGEAGTTLTTSDWQRYSHADDEISSSVGHNDVIIVDILRNLQTHIIKVSIAFIIKIETQEYKQKS